MAYGSTSYGIISEQPRSRSFGYERETHYNGEQIIFEASCDVRHLKRAIWKETCCAPIPLWQENIIVVIHCFVFWHGFPLSLIINLIYWLFCSIPLGCWLVKRVTNSWRLLLTTSRIYCTTKDTSCPCCSKPYYIQLDLDDISQMYVQDAKVVTGCLSTTILPTTVVIELKPGRRLDLYPRTGLRCCPRKPLPDDTVKLYFTHCANADDFVRVVENHIQSIQTFG